MSAIDDARTWLEYCLDNPSGQVDPESARVLLAELDRLRAIEREARDAVGVAAALGLRLGPLRTALDDR